MEDNTNLRISAFDTYYTNCHIQMLKIIYSALPSETRKYLAVYIRYLELQCALKYPILYDTKCNINFEASLLNLPEKTQEETLRFLDELLPYSNSSEKSKIRSLKNMIQNFNQIREMLNTLSLLQELFPDGFSGGTQPFSSDSNSSMEAFDFLSMLGGMSGMDMSEMLNIFGKEDSSQNDKPTRMDV